MRPEHNSSSPVQSHEAESHPPDQQPTQRPGPDPGPGHGPQETDSVTVQGPAQDTKHPQDSRVQESDESLDQAPASRTGPEPVSGEDSAQSGAESGDQSGTGSRLSPLQGQGGLSVQRREKMRREREKARQQALDRGPAGQGSNHSRPSPTNPFKDPRLAAAEAAGGPPPWLGTRWRQIPPHQQRDAWIGLRRWVDWLINEFRLPTQVIPACWYLHPDMTQELYAAMSMEYKAWEEAAPSLTPMMMWHPNLHAMIGRLREMVSNTSKCAKGEHAALTYMERDYDEQAWRSVAYGRREATTIERPKSGEDGFLVRARAVGPENIDLAPPSSMVGVAPIQGAKNPEVQLRRDRTTATRQSVIHLEAASIPETERIVWEKADTYTQDDDGNIVNAEWKPLTADESTEVEDDT